MNKLPQNLVETIKDDKFQDVLAGLGETAIDLALDEGVLKEIPIISSIFGLTKATMSIQDKLFAKKILSFLMQLENTNASSRRSQIERIDNDSNYKTKVGEKILFIIDKCDDNEKAILIGQLFKCFIQEKIQYEDFLRASKCIELTFLYDLKRFIKEKWDNKRLEDVGDLVGSGLMNAYYIRGHDGFGDGGNGTLMGTVSPIGRMIQQLLDES